MIPEEKRSVRKGVEESFRKIRAGAIQKCRNCVPQYRRLHGNSRSSVATVSSTVLLHKFSVMKGGGGR